MDKLKELRLQILRVGAQCTGGHHTKADHSDIACGRCGGSLVDPRLGERLGKLLDEYVEAVREEVVEAIVRVIEEA